MNIFARLHDDILSIVGELSAAAVLPSDLNIDRVSVETPRDASFGDMSSNVAMVLAKNAGMKPRELALLIVEKLLALPLVSNAEIAGPGFINITLDESAWRDILREILVEGPGYGASDIGAGQKVNVEYVSANPTGPLHIGHARGTVFGDVLASLLENAGFDVAREYYMNDAGTQVDVLSRSAHLRYREALGEAIGEIPSGLYPGDYLIPVGQAIAEKYKNKWVNAPESEWLPEIRRFTVDAMMRLVREDLAALGVNQDTFVSEQELVNQGKVEAAHTVLTERELIYTGVLEPPKGKKPDDWEPRPQELFRATEYGDDVDRPLRKSDGSWTYFASDIAYHFDKFERGYRTMIDVWGADHGGYVKRMQAATKAITNDAAELDVKICQIVKLMDNGEPIKMSKRAGTFVTLRDLVDEVGKDVVRFIMLTRSNDAPLEFDLKKVTEQSRENPVFYVQYAHARCHSAMRLAPDAFPTIDTSRTNLAGADLTKLDDTVELGLIKVLGAWPRVVEGAALAHEPHRIAYYLQELAAEFHGLWTKGRERPELRFIVEGDKAKTQARIALVRAVQIVLESGLNILGVEP
ncbi:MAG: arginine--tRNA ligase, partial [Rhodospirillaceae bacterium]|nr:arginine--tRNA ligase [Rhodospirillaceae bacterium]